MALTKEDVELLREMFSEAVQDHVCRFTMTDQQALQVSKICDVFEEVGSGDLIKGMREIRENHLWLNERRKEMEPQYTENHAFIAELRSGVKVAKSASIKVLIGALVTAILSGLVLLIKK